MAVGMVVRYVKTAAIVPVRTDLVRPMCAAYQSKYVMLFLQCYDLGNTATPQSVLRRHGMCVAYHTMAFTMVAF